MNKNNILFEVFNPNIHNFTYHPETTPKYYLSQKMLQDYCSIIRKEECDSCKDFDTVIYIETMETAHREFCEQKINSSKRRNIIEEKKKWFINKYGDRPYHANVIYDKFYNKVNNGRW